MIKAVQAAVAKILIRVILLVWTFVVVYPVIWVLYSSLKSNSEFYRNPWALPVKLHFENYYNAWIISKFYNYFFNSFIVVIGALILTLIMSTSTAYVFAKYKFSFLGLFESTYIGAMVIPQVLLLVPLFFQAKSLHMTDKLSALTLLYAVSQVPFSIFLLTGFIKRINNSYIEAGIMDGCSEFRLVFFIVIPMIKPGIFIAAIMNIMASWNEYVLALILLSDENKFTIPIGISYLSSTMQYRTDYGALFAGLVTGMTPILVVYGLFQNQLQAGMAVNSGVKC